MQPPQQQQYAATHSPNNGTSNNPVENGPRAKCDQVVFEAIAKAAEIVVGSRCWIDHIPPNLNALSSSRRFNLLVPEVQGVRSILQRWKRALHVPLRLDVYYQHPDSRRELLERWCLEYAPKTSTSYPTGNSGPLINQSADPIVQLRQVCKQIVIWLRCLYCWSRMLPAQALRSQNTQNNAIGFSIYVVSEGNDDVSGLISQQGFSSQSQPHSVVTPYGELGWKVFYAPKNAVQRLIPEISPYSQATSIPTNRTSSQPIPMRSQQYQQQQQQSQAQSFHPSRELMRRDSTPSTTIARSAPHNTGRTYQRSKSDISGGADNAGTLDDLQFNQQQGMSPHQLHQNPVDAIGWTVKDSTDPPSKTLSALSLAMMTLSDHDDGSNGNESASNFAVNAEAAEKRRAALHHAPPHLPQQSSPGVNRKSPLASAGEYGYAYNNHIPTLRSNNTPPNTNPLLSPSSTPVPTPLGSTPPGYLLGGPTPPLASNWSSLIPPRGAVTPPFTRPPGFVGEPPTQPLPPPASSANAHGIPNQRHFAAMGPGHQSDMAAPAPTTSLDLLHSSPFRQPIYGNTFVAGSSMAGVAEPFPSMNSGMGGLGDVAFSSSPGSGMYPRLQALDDPDDMPFAVDHTDYYDTGTSASATMAAAASSSTMIMRDMIQPPKRLQLFESMANDSHALTATAHDMTSFSDQLAEFKNFGASLTIHAADGSTGSEMDSSGAAISLRT